MLDENIAYVSPNCTTSASNHNFRTIQEAITWCGDREIMIKLCNNMIDVPQLKFVNEKTINIDGQGEYGLKFTDNLLDISFSLSAGQTFNFNNMKHLECEQIIINSDDANMNFYNCDNVIASLILTSGINTNINFKKTDLTGFTGIAAIEMNNVNTEVKIIDSTINGSINNPAILFNSDSNRNIKIKNSTILHGSADSPLENNGYNVGVQIYNCFSNKRICDNTITNWVYESNNIVDPEITF